MSRDVKEYTIWDAVTPQTVTSSTDATPIVVTKANHGYSTGDRVLIYGHTTNLAANGYYQIIKVDANSFQLRDIDTGAAIAGTGAGAGANGYMVIAPKIIPAMGYRNVSFSFHTSSSANFTCKIAGSNGKLASDSTAGNDTPNFGATQSKSNPYSLIQVVDLDPSTGVNGSTGLTSAGTDVHKDCEINTEGMKYFCPIITAWSAGVITLKATLTDNL